MRAHDFSQVIVLHDGWYSVLSTEGIAHWLEAKSKEDIIALSEVRLSDVLTFEPKDSCIYLKVNETVDRARQIFVNDIGKRIFSALVTEHGIAKEKPVNISLGLGSRQASVIFKDHQAGKDCSDCFKIQ